MCVDLFAVGRAITIRLLHEQLWFSLRDGRLQASIVFDAFLRNESDTSIEQLRIQFPHYVRLDQILVLSSTESLQQRPIEEDQFSWPGKFHYDQNSSEVTFDWTFQDCVLGNPSGQLQGMLLEGRVPPDGIFPTVASSRFLAAMREIDRLAVDLDLKTPLPRGRAGWLRIRLTPEQWPPDRVDLEPFEFLGGSHRFRSPVQIVSPESLRTDLAQQLSSRAKEWVDELVNGGWRKSGTLVRVEDHRISLVFPSTLEPHHIRHSPDGVLVARGPENSSLVGNKDLLHFRTGSIQNERRDLLAAARRVCDYCEYLQSIDPPTKDHLVTRCGGSEHESIGTLIDQMLHIRLLTEEGGRVRVCAKADRERLFLGLRRRYTFPEAGTEVPFLSRLRELHPFSISLAFRWTHFSGVQLARLKLLNDILSRIEAAGDQGLKLLDFLLGIEPVRRPLRKAIVVGCSRYDLAVAPAYVQVGTIAERLYRTLNVPALFDEVVYMPDPGTADEVIQTVRRIFEELSQNGMLLFWYIGHARQGANRDQLELQMTRAGNAGLEWRRLADEFQRHPLVDKIAVLDCCHAGLVNQGAVPMRTLVWPTTGPNHTAQAGSIVAGSGSAPLVNFSHAACGILEGRRSDQALKFKELFAEAQAKTVHNNFWGSVEGGLTNEPLIHDPSRRPTFTSQDLMAMLTDLLRDWQRTNAGA